MRRLGLPAAVVLALALWLARDVRLADPPAPRRGSPTARPGPAEPLPTPAPVPPMLRDPFRFGEAPREPGGLSQPATMAAEPTLQPAMAEPALRLAGFLRRAGRLLAVLSVRGDVLVLGQGEEAEGYRVLELDEERGARIRLPDGGETTLEPSR